MSWQEVTYWALRCDGEMPHGRQCDAVVFDDPNCHRTPVGWTGDGDPEQLPTMWVSKPYMSHPGWLQHLGWLHTGDRVLCPDHVQALEFLAEAEMCGLPFQEGGVAMIEHAPIEIHGAINGVVGDESPLLGHACRGCSPRELVAMIDAGETIDTRQVAWWPCSHLPPLEQVHEQIRAALPVPDAACLDNNHAKPSIDYLGDRDRLALLLPQLRDLADRHGWLEGDGSVQLTTDGLRITMSSNHPR